MSLRQVAALSLRELTDKYCNNKLEREGGERERGREGERERGREGGRERGRERERACFYHCV